MGALRVTFWLASALFALPVLAFTCTIVPRVVEAGPEFRITVSDRGSAVHGLWLRVGKMRAVTNGEGVAVFHNVAAGSYDVTTDRDDGGSGLMEVRVTARGPRDVNVHMKWPAVPPLEVRALTGTVHAFDRPSLFAVQVIDGIGGRIVGRTTTRSSGAFHFSNVPNGLYFLMVQEVSPDRNAFTISGRIAVELRATARRGDLHLDVGMTSCGLHYSEATACAANELELPAGFTGRVVDEGGAAVPDARVIVTTSDDRPVVLARSKADADGKFAMGDLAAGRYRLEVGSPGFSPLHATLSLRSATTRTGPRSLVIKLGLLGSQCSTVMRGR